MNDSSHAPIPPSGGAGLNRRLVSSLEALSRASSCLIAVVGLAVILGWHFDIELLPVRITWPHAVEIRQQRSRCF